MDKMVKDSNNPIDKFCLFNPPGSQFPFLFYLFPIRFSIPIFIFILHDINRY